MQNKSVYFPNLNGIRFIAAALVIFHHIDQYLPYFGYSEWHLKTMEIVGRLGVILFFVLSGFLITYLLLAEEESFKKISVKNFYIRRILRIWPLYFLVITLALLVIPHIITVPGFEKDKIYTDFGWKAFLYFTFFANLADAIYPMIPCATQAWSIGTEEQFYLVWPVLFRAIKKHRVKLMLGIVAFYLAVFYFLHFSISDFIPYKIYIFKFWKIFNIDCMAIGGFFAIMLYQGKTKLFLNKWLFYVVLAVTIGMISAGVLIPYIHNEFYAVLFGIIIVNFAANKNIGISLENPVLHYLGKISYGIYMYHIIAIVICLKVLTYFNVMSNLGIILSTFLLTIFMAGISYRFFESRFIRRKKKFSNIVSGENVEQAIQEPKVPVSSVQLKVEQ